MSYKQCLKEQYALMMIATTVGEKETTKQFRRKDKKLKDLHIDEPKVIPR